MISDNNKEPLSSRALDLAEVIDYQPGAVVSRTLIDKPEGTVSVFAFEAGEGLSEHTAPFDALVGVIEGTGEVVISSEKHDLKKGQIIIMPANRPHSVKAASRLKMMLVMIRGD
ncbi:MAG: cupin domain-containing protein [Candidatus Omnitrophica bacterium]|nr:cupin domain-containing protein [Candidatus Omnitrophota bacterium]